MGCAFLDPVSPRRGRISVGVQAVVVLEFLVEASASWWMIRSLVELEIGPVEGPSN